MLTSGGWCEKRKTPEENTRDADRRSEAEPLARIGSDIAGLSARYRDTHFQLVLNFTVDWCSHCT